MYTFISDTRDESSSSHVLINLNDQPRFTCYWPGEVVVFEEESGLTSSGSAKQDELQLPHSTSGSTYWHPLFYSRGRYSEHAGTLQAANHTQVLQMLPPIIIHKAK